MKIMNKAVYVVLSLCVIGVCGCRSSAHCRDRRYSQDIIRPNKCDYVFDPENLPSAGQSVDTIEKMSATGPTWRRTFIQPLQKELNNRKLSVDQIWAFETSRMNIADGGSAQGRDLIEIINVYYFIYQHKIEERIIVHKVREHGSRQMVYGRYNSINIDDPGIYPGSIEDFKYYWSQRSLEDRLQYSTSIATDEEKAAYKAGTAICTVPEEFRY